MFDYPSFAFEPDVTVNPNAISDAIILDQLRNALAADTLEMAYQPVIDNGQAGRVSFYEGLIRLCDATGKVIPAGKFIPLIENLEEGRMVDIAALRLGLTALYRDPALRLSINLSPKSITHPGWNQALREGLAMCPTIAERLILEITEVSMIEIPAIMCDFMMRLQALGIAFALDDFGAGYTAFRYFKDFRFDIVKINRAFIDGIACDDGNQAIVRALKAIADNFEMAIVVEGVERLADAKYLRASGLDLMQGYYFARPQLGAPRMEKLAIAG